MKTITKDYLEKVVSEWYDNPESVMEQIEGWLEADRSIALYRNEDLGSRACGTPKIVTCLHPEAQFIEEPPQTFPDFPGEVNWRFQLEGVLKPVEPQDTIKVEDLTRWVNEVLRLSTLSDEQKDTICNVLEHFLHATNNYRGFAYVKSDGSFGYEPDAFDFQEHRRMYYHR